MSPVVAKLIRHPSLISTTPISGTPMADANFEAPSNIAVARLRSCRGNQDPVALELAGKVGASPTPRRRRLATNPVTLVAAPPRNEASDQTRALRHPMSRTPNL